MMRRSFARHVERRPKRCLAVQAQADPSLVRHVSQRPGAHVVGMDEFAGHEWPPLAAGVPAPTDLHRYIGVVEEVDARNDQVTATLWESPSGQEFIATFSVVKHFHGETPQPLDAIRVWAWVELPGEGRQEDRVHVERWSRPPSPEALARFSEAVRGLDDNPDT